jgi:hypothetical protein
MTARFTKLPMTACRLICMAGLPLLLLSAPAGAVCIWVEGEKPVRSTMHRHPYWYDQVQRDQLSGGDLISNFHDEPGEASYRVNAPASGSYELWVRANPVQARLSFAREDGPWTAIDLEKDARETTNIAADRKIDLRYLAWFHVAKLDLRKGANTIRFRMDSPNHNHGYIDCFVLANEPFRPKGRFKPDELAAAAQQLAEADKGWFAFDPPPDRFSRGSAIDLRFLNEKVAGENGPIGVAGGQFIHTKNRRPVRFWAVNGPSGKGRDALSAEARMLAKHGVNLVRIHHGYFDDKGNVDPGQVAHAIEVVDAMKAEGIYSHFSIYFPLWLKPGPDTPWLRGYDGSKHPFAALYFNDDFQKQYQGWWKALLLTPNPATGKKLVDDPAVAGLEMINEDSYFFWTFTPANIPDVELRIIETKFGNWLKKRYGSIDATLRAWNGIGVDRDKPGEGRMGFRPLWNMAHDRTQRDRDTAAFLVDSQRTFYRETYRFLRGLGFKGVITASNWVTASAEVLGPLEKYSYCVGDFIDRHGYFSCHGQGEASEWSVREGHTYADRSALKFEGEEPGKPRSIVHPAMDPSYDGKPSMISETTWNRPNRYRSEAPLFYACYGALQDSDAIVHFALDGAEWTVKPGYFMQPWTLMSPAMMGQFPAAALIYRQGLVATGEVLADIDLRVQDLIDLKGTPLPQDAAFDELRLKDVPRGVTLKPGTVIDPLIHFAGRTNVRFSERGGKPVLKDLARYIDHQRRVVTSSTGQLRLDYGKGVLTIDAPAAQGASGALREAGEVKLKDLAITSNLELGHIVAVSLDGQPLATARKILLQVMSEERPSEFRTEPAANGEKRISNIGHDPWLVKQIEGKVAFQRSDAAQLKVSALDPNGEPLKAVGNAASIRLAPATVYYLIAR